MNKKFCVAYNHKRGKHLDSDRSGDEHDDKYPGEGGTINQQTLNKQQYKMQALQDKGQEEQIEEDKNPPANSLASEHYMHNAKQTPADNSQVEMGIGPQIYEETEQAVSIDIDDVQGHR
eukprot:909903-Heterocapsa_arctica.AAC.1